MANEIIPRWEWRTFAADLQETAARIAAHGQPRIRESAEVYVLSRASDNNTKIRDGKMDIKTLREVNANGLELWLPILKHSFPVSQNVLNQTCAAWGVSPPAMPGDCDMEPFLSTVVRPHPQLAAVDVFKERHGFMVDGCIVEFANLRFDDQPMQTVAVEMEDPEKVLSVVRLLGLTTVENINYVQALKRFKKMTG